MFAKMFDFEQKSLRNITKLSFWYKTV